MTPKPLRILFDARMASWGGVGRYTTGLLGGLAEIAEDAGVNISALRMSADTHLFPQTALDRVHWLNCKHGPWTLRGLEEAARAARADVDVFHTPHITLFPPGFSGARVGTLHDVIPLQHPNTISSPHRRVMFRALLHAFVTRADWLLFGSRRAATDAIAAGLSLPHFSIVLNAVDDRFRVQTVEEQHRACRQIGVRPGSIMWVGPFKRHKNLEALIQAYALLPDTLRSEVELVLAGANHNAYGRELSALAAELIGPGQPGQVRFPGYVPDDLLPALLSSAALYVFPSLSEGFGLPALEARSCGAPVATSDTTPVREFLGNNAWYFDPRKPENLAELLGTLLSPSGQLGNRLGARPSFIPVVHTWRHTASVTAQCYHRAYWLRRQDNRAFPYHLLPCIEETVSPSSPSRSATVHSPTAPKIRPDIASR